MAPFYRYLDVCPAEGNCADELRQFTCSEMTRLVDEGWCPQQ